MFKAVIAYVCGTFVQNLPWKLGALFFATAIWFVIMNFVDPVRTELIPLQLELRNEQALTAGHLEILLENRPALLAQTVTVQVRGNQRRINEISHNWRAYIDLSTSDIIYSAAMSDSLPVNIQVDGDFDDDIQLLAVRPVSVILSLDTIINRAMEVTVDLIGDEHPDFFIPRESITRNPRFVTVTGPSSAVARIDRLAVGINVDGRTVGLNTTRRPGMYDMRGEPIVARDITISDLVEVYVPVHVRGRAAIASPTFDGVPPEGYVITGRDWNPKTLDIAGLSAEAVDAAATIHLPPISEEIISRHTSSFTEYINITPHLPAGVYLIEGHRNMIAVDVVVERLMERDFIIPINNITLLGAAPNMQVFTDFVYVRLVGVERLMQPLEYIYAIADLSGLEEDEGEHIVNVQLVLNVDIMLADGQDAPYIEVLVLPVELEYYEDDDE